MTVDFKIADSMNDFQNEQEAQEFAKPHTALGADRKKSSSKNKSRKKPKAAAPKRKPSRVLSNDPIDTSSEPPSDAAVV